MGNEGSGAPTVHEIFTKINNAKDKTGKIAILKQFDNQAMRQLLKAAFADKRLLVLFKLFNLRNATASNKYNSACLYFKLLDINSGKAALR